MSKKSPFKVLSERIPTPDEYQAAWQEVQTDGPRGSVILASTLVERSLKDLLTTNLHPDVDKGADKDLFGPLKPLGSFSAKIRLGFGMRLYGPITFHDLDLLRELRNLFAHGPLSMSFNDPTIKEAIFRFKCHSRGVPDPRERFFSAATLLLEHLIRKRKDLSHSVPRLD